MDLYVLSGQDEKHPVYQAVAASNGIRHYQFLISMVEAARDIGRPMLSHFIIKAINFHAIAGLHDTAGTYRPCPVQVGTYSPPPHYRVQAMMADCANHINWSWQSADAVTLAAHALWQINYIHPFIDGNGRTARAVCYFILCLKAGGPLPGNTILPEMLGKQHRPRYVAALQKADKGDLQPLVALITDLLSTQISGASGQQTP